MSGTGRHVLFLRWWLTVTLTALGALFAGQFGIFHEIYDKDITKLSLVIVAGFIFMSAWCGIKTFRLSRLVSAAREDAASLSPDEVREIDTITNLEEAGWFAAGVFTSLGMIGTVIGMIFALKGFINVDVSEVTSVQKLISNMVFGVSTALYTTLVGLVCSTLLKIQYFNLGHARRGLEKE